MRYRAKTKGVDGPGPQAESSTADTSAATSDSDVSPVSERAYDSQLGVIISLLTQIQDTLAVLSLRLTETVEKPGSAESQPSGMLPDAEGVIVRSSNDGRNGSEPIAQKEGGADGSA